ncbi:MAG: hypothetical protein ACTHNS_12670 [Marmoricola sp.]
MSESRKAAGARLSLITIDQAAAGASNVVVAVLAARLLSAPSFGLFGLIFLVYALLQGVSRAIVGDPLLVHPEDAEQRPEQALGTGLALGLALGVLACAAAGVAGLWNGSFAGALAVLGVLAPMLVLQDLGRYLGFAVRRPGVSLVLDLVWLVLVVAGAVVLAVVHERTLVAFIAVWAGSGALAGALTGRLFALRLRPDLTWLREKWSFAWRYLISYASTQGGALAGGALVVGLAGARALAGIQGALLLVRPFMTVQTAAIAAGVSDIARAEGDGAAVRASGLRISALTGALAAANALVLLVLPGSWGSAVLGASWSAAQPLLLPTAVQVVLLGLMTGARSGLLGLRAVDTAVRIDVPTTVGVLVATVVGALVDGARGAVWAVAVVQLLATAVWWASFWSRTGPGGARGVLVPPGPVAAQPTVETLPRSLS